MQSRFLDDVKADVDIDEYDAETEATAGGDVERAAGKGGRRAGREIELAVLHAAKTPRRRAKPNSSAYNREVHEVKEALRSAVKSARTAAEAIRPPSGSSLRPPSPSPSDPRHSIPCAQRANVSVRIVEGVSEALCCAWDKGIVHSDVRPHNIVMVPSQPEVFESVIAFQAATTDLGASFDSILIDWASSRKLDEIADDVTGMAAFQSDELLKYFQNKPSTELKPYDCSSRWRLFFQDAEFTLRAMEDAQALGHTLVALLHGGPALTAPWSYASTTGVAKERNEWYMAHEKVSPTCPCLAFRRALYNGDPDLRATKKPKQITKQITKRRPSRLLRRPMQITKKTNADY
jgi:serine/threonine protein kinase